MSHIIQFHSLNWCIISVKCPSVPGYNRYVVKQCGINRPCFWSQSIFDHRTMKTKQRPSNQIHMLLFSTGSSKCCRSDFSCENKACEGVWVWVCAANRPKHQQVKTFLERAVKVYFSSSPFSLPHQSLCFPLFRIFLFQFDLGAVNLSQPLQRGV